jgi:methyltransferase family protein
VSKPGEEGDGDLAVGRQRDPQDLRFCGTGRPGAGAEQVTCGPSLLRADHGQLEMVSGYLRQLGWAAGGDHTAPVQHGDMTGEPVGFLHVLRRQQDGGPGRDLFADQVPQLPPAARVKAGGRLVEEQHADVGCGSGVTLLTLAAAFPRSRFDGYDPSRYAIERAGQNLASWGLANVTYGTWLRR